MAASMESRLVGRCLGDGDRPSSSNGGLLAHSDRGSQDASDHYQRVLADAKIVCSTSVVGQCWDNAPVESLFGRLTCELGVTILTSHEQTRSLVFEYLEVFYNRVRRHSSLGYVSPRRIRAHAQPLYPAKTLSTFRGNVTSPLVTTSAEWLGGTTHPRRTRPSAVLPLEEKAVDPP